MKPSGSITDEQRDALAALVGALGASTYLAGGVGIASHLHHRISRDLDLFVPDADPVDWLPRLESLDGIVVISRSDGTVYLEMDGVPVSIIRYEYPLLAPAEAVDGLPIAVASLEDLACMKLSAIASRGARRDFWDLHEIVARGVMSLADALAGFSRKYAAQDVGHVIKSLVYFADAEAEPSPSGLTVAHWNQIKDDLRDWVRRL